MPNPKAYSPEKGYMFQILVQFPGSREYEHCDYAVSTKDRNYLLQNYREAYRGSGASFRVIGLPQKYWASAAARAAHDATIKKAASRR